MPQRTQAIEFETLKSLQLKKNKKEKNRDRKTVTEKNESALEGQDKYGGGEDFEVMRDNAM